MCGTPSGPMSAWMRPDNSSSGSYETSPSRIASMMSLAETFWVSMSMIRRPLTPGRQRRAHQPRPLRILRAERDGEAAAFRPRDAEIDVGECPLLAVALVVDREVAALEADLGQVAAVEPAGVKPLDPGEHDWRNPACRRARRARARASGPERARTCAAVRDCRSEARPSVRRRW